MLEQKVAHASRQRLVRRATLIAIVLQIAALEDVVRIAAAFEVQQTQLGVLSKAVEKPRAALAFGKARCGPIEHLAKT